MRSRVSMDGVELNAEFSVQPAKGHWAITLESRGGGGRNSDYERGLEILLTRLTALDGVLEFAEVTSQRTAGLAREARRLNLAVPLSLPLRLSDTPDVHALRLALGRAQARTAQSPGAKGGNPTKRVTLALRFTTESWDGPAELEKLLASDGASTTNPTARRASAGAIPAAPQWTPRSAGQGFTDAPTNCAVEARAMELAVAHFSLRFAVDTSPAWSRKPYDLRCSGGERSLDVEVKGTQSQGRSVLVSRGEVEHARAHEGHVALCVVHSIRVSGTPPVATGGVLHVLDPWVPQDADLQPVQYLLRVAPATANPS